MFSVRDLLIVAALLVGGVTVAYRSAIQSYCEPVIAPVEYYVDAPAREAGLQREIDQLKELVQIGREQEEKSAAACRELGETVADYHSQITTLVRRMGDAGRLIEAQRSELETADNELAKLRSRYAALCQRLVELGNDVPNVLAAE